MSYTATKVADDISSYTFTQKGLYVFTGSRDGGYNVTEIGGTATALYYKHASAGTVIVLWAEANDTFSIVSAVNRNGTALSNVQNYTQLVKISGFSNKPKVKYSAEGESISTTGKKNNVYIGMVTGYKHSEPWVVYSFTCTGAKTEIADSTVGWSTNAMALMIPSSDSAVGVTCSLGEARQGYLVQLSTDNCYIKVSGTWKRGKVYIKQNGAWKEGELRVKQGTWKGAI